MYNEINAKYPRKPDLRKCFEFRQWQNGMAIEHGQETVPIRKRRPYRYHISSYNNIDVNPDSRTVQGKIQQRTMQLNIELLSLPRDNNYDETTVEQSSPPFPPEEHPDRPEQPLQEPLPEPLPGPLPEPLQVDPFRPDEEIPPQQPLPEPLQVDPFRPDEEISPQIIDKILSELRLDPELNAIMDDVETEIEEQRVVPVVHTECPVEQNVESEIPELEVDIPELSLISDQDDIFW